MVIDMKRVNGQVGGEAGSGEEQIKDVPCLVSWRRTRERERSKEVKLGIAASLIGS